MPKATVTVWGDAECRRQRSSICGADNPPTPTSPAILSAGSSRAAVRVD